VERRNRDAEAQDQVIQDFHRRLSGSGRFP
jgi:hypothetical protein